MAPQKKTAKSAAQKNQPSKRGNYRRNNQTNNAGAIGPGVASATWVPSTYRIITAVTGNTFQDYKLSSNTDFTTYLKGAGEYRLRRLRAVWQPLMSDPRVGTIICHPYFDDTNAGTSLVDLFAAGNKSRPANTSFQTVIQYRQEPQASSIAVQGGLTFQWTTNATNAATATPGIWTLWIDLDQRGLKPTAAVTYTQVLPALP